MSANIKVKPKVSARKKFLVGGVEKELFMSFSIHQRIITICGGLDEVITSFSNPVTQMELLVLTVMGRDCPIYTETGELYALLDDLELGADEATLILDWIQDFIVDFTFAQMQSLGEKYQKAAEQLQQVQKGSTST